MTLESCTLFSEVLFREIPSLKLDNLICTREMTTDPPPYTRVGIQVCTQPGLVMWDCACGTPPWVAVERLGSHRICHRWNDQSFGDSLFRSPVPPRMMVHLSSPHKFKTSLGYPVPVSKPKQHTQVSFLVRT